MANYKMVDLEKVWVGTLGTEDNKGNFKLDNLIDYSGFLFIKTDFRECNLNGVIMKNAIFQWVSFEKSNLNGADLSGSCSPVICFFNDARLIGANLSGVNFSGPSFKGADLRCANLSNAKFINADFSGADLRGANLCWAEFNLVDFSGADLTGAIMKSAQLDDKSAKQYFVSRGVILI